MRHSLLSVLLLAACASASQQPLPDPDRITAEEIAASSARNLYDLIEHARPRWLVNRSGRSTRLETVMLVYQDGVKLGGLDVLQDLPLLGVRSIRILDAAEAGQLPGLGSQHVERVIYITTRDW